MPAATDSPLGSETRPVTPPTVSVWSKPGAWALDAEQEDDRLAAAAADESSFPSLAAATTAKAPKKKKPQPVSLAEFTTGKPAGYGAGRRGEEVLVLPTAPRERTEEEIGRARYGGGFRDEGRWPSRRGFDEPRRELGVERDLAPSRADEADDWGAGKGAAGGGLGERRGGGYGGFDRSDRDLGPSRADEVDDWSAGKATGGGGFGERRGGGFGERRGGGYGGSDRPDRDLVPSRADEVDDWGAGKRFAPPPPPAGERRVVGYGGFDRMDRDLALSRADGVDDWGAGKRSPAAAVPAPDAADRWGRREEVGVGGRRRLVLQPRTLPIGGGEVGSNGKAKGPSPFGEARPREEILAEKGQDWRKIDEQLETMRVKEAGVLGGGMKGFARPGMAEEPREKSWRKPEVVEDAPRLDFFPASMTLFLF